MRQSIETGMLIMAKKLFGIVLPLIILFCLCSCGASASEAKIFGLLLTDGRSAQGAEIHWFAHRNGEHYLFLPAGVYGCESKIVSRLPGRVSVDGVSVLASYFTDAVFP